MISPLLGKNLVRLVYLDEAGADFKVSHLCVAGVIVHADTQYFNIDKMFDEICEAYIPGKDREDGFEFHATDIFHGSRYFDRRNPEWPEERRFKLLNDIAEIIDRLNLPVVTGFYEKAVFGRGTLPAMAQRVKETLIHSAATVDCIVRADKWLARYAPSELATIVHEDGPPAKKLIKKIVRELRSNTQVERAGGEELAKLGFPLKRIVDTVHFAAKADARPLQMADLCAFIFGRMAKGLPVPEPVEKIVFKQSIWMFEEALAARRDPLIAPPPEPK